MFIHKALKFSTLIATNFCKDNNFEVCTILLEISYTKSLVITVYRSLSGHFELFLNRMDVRIDFLNQI